ncbi:MAG: LuxR C-terminal-related transcriptional regulator [Streptosporangiaceae bacterium]
MGADTEKRESTATVLFTQGFLARALAVGLHELGWQIRNTIEGTLNGRVVVAVDNDVDASLPGLRLGAVSQLVLVGGLNCLAILADAVLWFRAGAAINADQPFPEVIKLVDAALRADPLSRDSRQRLHDRLRERKAESDRFERLTNREAAVLADLIRGLDAAEIARRRPVALATVRSQIAAILRKLEVPSQAAAVVTTYRACRDRRVLEALRFHQNY